MALCCRAGTALQGSVGCKQSGGGSDSQAEIAHSASASEGKQESLPQLSPPLQGTELILGIPSQSGIRSSICLHMKSGPVASNAFSEGFALACPSGESQQIRFFHSSASDLWHLEVCTHTIWTCCIVVLLITS